MSVISQIKQLFSKPKTEVTQTNIPASYAQPISTPPAPVAPKTPAQKNYSSSASSAIKPGTPIASGVGGGYIPYDPSSSSGAGKEVFATPATPPSSSISPPITPPSSSRQYTELQKPSVASSKLDILLPGYSTPEVFKYQKGLTPAYPYKAGYYYDYNSPSSSTQYYNVLSEPKRGGFIDASSASLKESSLKYQTALLRGQGSFAGELKMFGVGALSFGVGLLYVGRHPLKTAAGLGMGIYNFASSPVESSKIFAGKVRNIFYEPPSAGFVGGYIASAYATGGIVGSVKGVAVKPIQQLNIRLNPRGVLYGKTGIKLVEGMTIPTPKAKLIKIENQIIDTVHMTLSPKLKVGSKLSPPEDISSVGGFRRSIEQFNFYQSIPSEGRPVLYGGYAGIGKGISSGGFKLAIKNPTPQAFIFRGQAISQTPLSVKSLSVKEIVKYQTTRPGTYIPGENIVGASIEGQVATSVGKRGAPLFEIAANPAGQLYNRFTYYNIKKTTPSFIQGKPLLTRTWDTITSRNVKINFQEVKLKQIGEGKAPSLSKSKDIIDIEDYSSSMGSRYISVGSYSKYSVSMLSSDNPVFSSKQFSYSRLKKSPMRSLTYSQPPVSNYISSIGSGGSGGSDWTSSFGGGSGVGSGSSIISSPGTHPPIIPITPKLTLPQFEFEGRKPKRQSFGRGFKYSPSLAAVGLGIESAEMPKGIETGLVLRPIIRKRRKR